MWFASQEETPIRPVAHRDDVAKMEQIPFEDRALPASTYDMIVEGAALAPDGPALSYFLQYGAHKAPFTLSYRALLAKITQAANMFRAHGIGRTDVVAMLLPNMPDAHYTLWGGEAAGIVFPINPMLEPSQIAALMNQAGVKAVVALGPMPSVEIWQKLTEVAPQVESLQVIFGTSLIPYAPGKSPQDAPPLPAIEGFVGDLVALDDAMAEQPGDALGFETPKADDIASYFGTGGTTGLPKIAVRTHLNEVYECWAMRRFAVPDSPVGEVTYCGLPLFHVNGQLVTGLMPFSAGGHVILGTPQGYRGEGVLPNFWELVEHFKVASFSGVPTVYATLLQVPVGDHDISSLRYGYCGAAPMPVQLFEAFQDTTGLRILESYGMTEGGCASSVNPPGAPPRIGSVGIALPYHGIRVVNLDDNGAYAGDAGVGEVGAVALHGPNVFNGYLSDRHNDSIWLDIDGERWFNTGDLGRLDADGYLWLTGRKKELIIRGGHNIDPAMIEGPVYDHPDVALAAAVGRPDVHAGELPVLYVQPKAGTGLTADALKAHAETTIPERAARPVDIQIIDAMPVTAVNKIFKPALIMREIEGTIRREAEEAGVPLSSVSVVQDSARGLVAKVASAGAHDPLSQALGRYTFHVDFT